MSELKLLSESESRNVVGDWALRIGAGGVYIIFGLEKFSSAPGSHWVKLFNEIGAGDWFRYLTGVIEVLGGLLVVIPQTAAIGLIILALTMAGAVLIVALIIGRAMDSIFPGIFLLGLIGLFIWNRRKS
jgi:uncharacterized membrane protein YphA (DoxX/SURF4 family)